MLRAVVARVRDAIMHEIGPLLEGLASPGVEVLRTDVLDTAIADAFARAHVAITRLTGPSVLREPIAGVAQKIDRHNMAEMRRVLALNIRENDLHTAGWLDTFVRRNVDLITSVGRSSLNSVEEIVSRAHASGLRVEVLREQILARFDVTESRAALIARDQVLKANGQLTQLRQQSAGVTEYVWITSRDECVRGDPDGKWPNGSHFQLDGTTQQWAVPPVVDDRTGRTGHPGSDYSCRCTASPVLDQLLGDDDE